MSATREIIIGRIRCPYCGGAALKVYATRPTADGTDDVRRYTRCRTCGEKFTVRITDSSTPWNLTAQTKGKLNP